MSDCFAPALILKSLILAVSYLAGVCEIPILLAKGVHDEPVFHAHVDHLSQMSGHAHRQLPEIALAFELLCYYVLPVAHQQYPDVTDLSKYLVGAQEGMCHVDGLH